MKDKHSREFVAKQTTRFELVKSLRDNGATYKEVAEALGVTPERAGDYCCSVGLGYNEQERRENNTGSYKPRSLEYWRNKVKDKYKGQFELVTVGALEADTDRHITIRCVKCGQEKSIRTGALRKHNGHCINCKSVRTKRLKEIDKAEREQRRFINKPRKQVVMRFCECGQLLSSGRKYCESCRQEHIKEQWRIGEVKRRARLKKVKHEPYTLKQIYRRDNGICYLCGGLCDYNDFKVKGDTIICGDYYPSVDHIIALANGGADTLDNIKLAHRLCNSKKANTPVINF